MGRGLPSVNVTVVPSTSTVRRTSQPSFTDDDYNAAAAATNACCAALLLLAAANALLPVSYILFRGVPYINYSVSLVHHWFSVILLT